MSSKSVKKDGRVKIDFEEILARYRTGQYSITQLAKEYGVSKSHLSVVIKKNNVKISEHSEQAISHLHEGFKELALAKSEQNGEQLVKTTLDIVQEKNPIFAKTIQVLSSKLLKKSIELVDLTKDADDLLTIANTMQKVNDTLQVIPKQNPQTQINIQNNNANFQNQNGGNSQNQQNMPSINIVSIKNKDDLAKAREAIEGEVIE